MPRIFLVFSLCTVVNAALFGQIDSFEVHKSPYSVIYNHLYYLQPDSYQPDRAAMSFNTSPDKARTLAIQLKQILDGKGLYVDINRLPVKNNYIDSLSKEAIYFIDRDDPLIYVERIDSLWYYSRTTAEAIPGIYEKLYPFGDQIARYFRAPAWQYEILGLRLWKWLGMIALLVASLLVFYVVKWASNNTVSRFLVQRLHLAGDIQRSAGKLARILGLIGGLHFLRYFLPMLQLPPWTNAMLLKSLGTLSIFFIILVFLQLVNILFFELRKVTEKTSSNMDDQLLPVLRRIALIVVWVLGAIYILDSLNVNVTALLAGISIGGLAIALAAQDTVKNVFGSIMIFIDKPFQIGDWIHFNDVDGVVEEVGIRSTRIRTFANSLTYVPNGMLADQVVDNLGLRIYRRFKTDISITYDTSPTTIDLFVKGIREIIRQHPTTRKDYFEVHLNSFGASSLNILLYTFFEAPNWTVELKGRHDLMFAIIMLANELGVRFAFPTQTLHIEELPGHGTTTPDAKAPNDVAGDLKTSLTKIKAYFRETMRKDTNEADKFKPLGGA